MKKEIIILGFLIAVLGGCASSNVEESMDYTNILSDDRMLLVLSAPSIHDTYYAPAFDRIVDFHVNYAKKVIGNDNIVIIVDADTKIHFEGKVPDDVLLVSDIHDIWTRDFSTVNPLSPVQFTYTWASMTREESEQVQASFEAFANTYNIKRVHTDYILDGGNLVDNYQGKIITTTRFLEDNDVSYEEGKRVLKELLNAKEVAILEPDEEVLAHSDGMVMWVDEDILLVNDYSQDKEYQENVLTELRKSFPTTTIVEVPVRYKENPDGEWEGFSSACGVHVNSVLTYNNLYVPLFNMEHDEQVLKKIEQQTTKNVIPIDAQGVCPMGGSVRCLTWQLVEENAEKMIEAARK